MRRAEGLVLAAALVACRGEHEQAVRAEAGRVLRAVETLRDASNAEKAALLERLEHEPCSAPEVCELKTECARAYRLHVGGLRSADEARAALAESAPEAQLRAVQLTQAAERDLAAAKLPTQRCAELSGTLRRTIDG